MCKEPLIDYTAVMGKESTDVIPVVSANTGTGTKLGSKVVVYLRARNRKTTLQRRKSQ
jgi:hypothetical protein